MDTLYSPSTIFSHLWLASAWFERPFGSKGLLDLSTLSDFSPIELQWVPDSGFRIQGFRFRAPGSGFSDSAPDSRSSPGFPIHCPGVPTSAPSSTFWIQSSTAGRLLCRKVKRFRGGLVFKAHRLVYRSTLGWRVMNNKKVPDAGVLVSGFGSWV